MDQFVIRGGRPLDVQGIYGNPDFDWKGRKTKQVRDLYQEHPDQVWVLEEGGQLHFPRKRRTGHIDARPYMAPTMRIAQVEFRKLMKEVSL